MKISLGLYKYFKCLSTSYWKLSPTKNVIFGNVVTFLVLYRTLVKFYSGYFLFFKNFHNTKQEKNRNNSSFYNQNVLNDNTFNVMVFHSLLSTKKYFSSFACIWEHIINFTNDVFSDLDCHIICALKIYEFINHIYIYL